MEEKVMEVLKEIRPDGEFDSSTNYIEDGLLDSFDMIQLVSRIEEEFSCEIDGLDIAIENFDKMESIVKLIIKNGGAI